MAASETINLAIVNREGTLYQGVVRSLTSVNEKGEFDILARHENFITLVREKVAFVDQQGQAHQMAVQQGILQVKDNMVKLFLGIGKDDLLGEKEEVRIPSTS